MENKDSEILPADAQGTPCDFNELVSTMEPDFSADTLSVYLESCEPFSVTDPEPSHKLAEPNIPRTDALVDPFNSILLTESNSGRFDHTLNKIDKNKSSSTRKSTRKVTSIQKTDTTLAARRSRRTSGKKPMLDLLAADVGRRRRSDSVTRARPSTWGLGGKIDVIFKQNEEHIESRKGRTGRKGGKKTTDFVNQSIQNKGLLLKFKLGTKPVQNCQLNMIPGVDTDLESYMGVKIEPLQSDIKENYEKEGLSASDENLDKRVTLEASERSEDLSVENSCLDPGTSPDSEVINVIPETQISGVGSGILSPEIVNDEKQIEGSCSSGASMSITTGIIASLQETGVEAPIDILTIESGTKTDLNIDSVNKKSQKGSQANGKVNCDIESHPITEEGSPLSAWVCCDDCHKWRRISAILADSIESTECRWICKDNMDKAFADCSIPQEKSNADINEELELSDASCEEDASNTTRLNSNHSGQKQQDPPQPSWKLIKTNMFLHRNRKNQTIDEIMVCHCKPPLDGRMGCRDECLNRMLNIECVKGTCPCGEFCSNQQFQKRKYSKLKCFPCGKKGYGLQLQEDILKGRFLIEYVGEVLDMPAYDARQREYALKGHKHFYFMTLNGSEVIDACAKGNLGRFINHSCQPNCRTEKWMVNGEVCIGLFAIRDIKKGEELTFDYNYVRVFGAAAKKCVCGSSRCRGVIGGDPLNSETVVLGDSDDEYPEPVYENTTKLDNLISGTETHTEPSPDSFLAVDDKIDDPAIIPIASTEREVSFERSSSESKVEEPDVSLKVNEMKTEISSFDAEKHKKTGASKKKPKSHKSENKCVILKTQLQTKLPSSTVKRGKSKTYKPPPEMESKPVVVPQKPLTGRFEAVQEALNNLLNSDGGISKRRDGWKGYLKLLCLTAHSGNGEGIQSNRDLSMILDALLKTKSRTVLLDIINKNGLQMLHNLMKHYRKEFNKIPILRKLLKVLEFLAETKILTLENILKPSPNGAESFKESILSLTEHTDKQVHQIARNFRDRWIPWYARKIIRAERDVERMELEPTSSFKTSQGQNSHFTDREKRLPEVSDNSFKPSHTTPPVEASTASCVSRTRTRKRKSRWDEAGDVDPVLINKEPRLNDETDAPPGFSSPVNRQLFPATVKGHLQDRYNSRLPTAFGVPSSFFQQTGGAAAATVVAPAMTFHPFPPLPAYPRRCTDSNPGFERFRNPNTLGRRYYKQQKWHNSRSGWNPSKYGQNPPNMGGGYGGYYEQQQQQGGL